jgi:two-component system chemotaxis sensor kinase CheA
MTFEDEMASALENFMLEATDLLAEMETGLLALEQDSEDEESINSVFRAAHTVKGSAGLFGLDPVVRFTHVVESVLDRMRSQEISASAGLIGALLPCKDHIGDLIAGIAAGAAEETPAQAAAGAALLARLEPYLSTTAPTETETESLSPATDSTAELVHLSLRFGQESLRNGMDPLSFLRYLSTLGEIVALTTCTDLLPETEDLDAEQCYLYFQVTLRTEESLATVEGVFDFVREDSDIRVLSRHSRPAEYADLVASFGPHGRTVAGILVAGGAISATALRDAIDDTLAPVPSTVVQAAFVAEEMAEEVAAVPAPRSAVASVGVPPAAPTSASAGGPSVPNASTAGRRAGDRGAAENQTIRVDAGRLDRLIDAVGELVIAGAGAELRASMSKDEALQTALGEVMRLVEEVRDGALQLRMVPIGTTFSRFQRIVRDVSATLGKDVTLTVSGGDTEVDKALVEQIGDPLTHLVRNALDHGIESAEVRAAQGKPARGSLRLNAFHDSGSIVIEVQDDGGGIDPDLVLAKAIERGLVEPNAVLSEKDIYGLIFEPGFSTAATVSDLSGRGVGMDVVKRNVTALRGTIDVESKPGQGTTLRIRLPLTLAIIDGFLVGVGGATFVIPLDRVVECVELPAESRNRDYMGLRGEVLSFVRLRSLFAIRGERPRRENVVVVEYAGTKTGLVVDALKGEFQTVIKPLGALFGNVQGIGGSTILGNGDVALIVDVPTLVRHAEDWQHARLASA